MNQKARDIIRVTAFLDGRPGHEKQTKGILTALDELIETEVSFVKVPYNSFAKDLLSHLNLFVSGKKSHQRKPYPDLVIGTGRRTHLPLLHCAKETNAKAVCCMSPAKTLRSRFDLCFVPKHDGITEAKNILHTIGPPNISVPGNNQKEEAGLILVGGTDISHKWDNDQIKGCLETIVQSDEQINWTVSSSPRTPDDCVTLLEQVAKNFSNCFFYRYQDTPAGWVEEQYASCRKVWVTADSMSMVYEALSAGCSVGLIPVLWKNKNSKFAKSERQLEENNIVMSYHGWSEGEEGWKSENPPLNESLRCAEEIVRRWFRKN